MPHPRADLLPQMPHPGEDKVVKCPTNAQSLKRPFKYLEQTPQRLIHPRILRVTQLKRLGNVALLLSVRYMKGVPFSMKGISVKGVSFLSKIVL